MGWKSIRDHYGLNDVHGTIKIEDGRVHIGSGYMGSILILNPDGSVHEKRDRLYESIGRFADAVSADPETFREMFRRQDTFERAITVYTWSDDRILERQCEELGWPNVTHDGAMMADNRYSADRDEVIRWALQDASSGVKAFRRHVVEAESALVKALSNLSEADRILDRLLTAYPDQAETALPDPRKAE